MRYLLKLLFLMLLGAQTVPLQAAECSSLLNHSVKKLGSDETVNLCEAYQGKVVLIVNTASKCGFTPQFEGLEALYDRNKDRGLVVLGFPSNDFNQELSSEQEVQQFCRLTYGVRFPMFAKTHAKESLADPLYQSLGKAAGEFPKWNFHKYLVDREGRLIGSYRSQVAPDSRELLDAIEKAL
jgi:glutathione peroxidase